MKNNTIIKITFLLIIFMLILAVSPKLALAETEPEKIIYKDKNGNYLVYYKDYCKSEYGYAIAASSNTDVEPTILTGSMKDGGSEELNVILIPAAKASEFENNKAYVWINVDGSNFVVKADKIDLTEAIDDEMMEEVNKDKITTKTDGQYEVEKVIDGVNRTVKLGKIDILDEGQFEYVLISVKEGSEEEKLYNLAEKMSEEVNGTYEKLSINKQFSDYYKQLKTQTSDWEKVDNNMILQPDSAQKGDKYLVAIKDRNDVVDIKFFVSDHAYTPEYKAGDKVVVEPVATPKTYDSIALFFILGIIIIAIIIVAILRKKNNKGNH